MQYIPGKENVVADALSRWAYPASKAFADTSVHGSEQDDLEMQALIAQEREEEKTCRVIHLKDWVKVQEPPLNPIAVEVVTRSGRGIRPSEYVPEHKAEHQTLGTLLEAPCSPASGPPEPGYPAASPPVSSGPQSQQKPQV